MIDLNIKNDEEKVTAEYLLKSNDRIDNLTLGMMVNNDIEGFLPVQPVQVENDRYFRYDITGLVTMKEYLGEYVKKDRFRCWIISVMCYFVFYHTYSILPVRCYACIQPFNSTHHSF